jgi:PKD repeat protein
LISGNSCGNDTLTRNVEVATRDVKPVALVGLNSACTQSPISVIRVSVQNLRTKAIPNVKIAYQINGGAIVNGVIANIGSSATVSYPFTQRADLSADGTYNIKVWTNDSLDFDRSNDTVNFTIVNQTKPNAGFSAQIGTNGAVSFTNSTTSDATATYAWNFGDNATSTDANPSHTYTQSGTYTVIMIATSACGSDTTIANVSVVVSGVELQANEKYVRAYPNPNNGNFRIECNELIENIEVYDVQGKLIDAFTINSKVSTFNLNVKPGTYSVKINTKNNITVHKIIIL